MTMLKENEDYELVPDGEDAWSVRITKGPYVETVVTFNTIKLDGNEGELRFNFDITSSPDPDLVVEDQDLQQHVANILYALILTSIEDEAVDFKEE